MKKKFDCVKMKHDIQEQLHKEMEGMSLDAKFQYLRNKPLNNPKLEKFVEKVNQYHRDNNNNVFDFGEPKSEYKTN